MDVMVCLMVSKIECSLREVGVGKMAGNSQVVDTHASYIVVCFGSLVNDHLELFHLC